MAGDPTLTSLDQISPTTVRVTWSPPSGGATVTGYAVHYRTATSIKIKRAVNTSTSTLLTGLTSGSTYTISVEATSQHLSGESEEVTISLSELTCIIHGRYIQCLLHSYACKCINTVFRRVYCIHMQSWKCLLHS